MILGMSICLSIVSLHVSLAQSPSCTLRSPHVNGYFQEGDIMLAGFFPVHTAFKEQRYTFRDRIQPITCDSFSSMSYSWVQSMVYTIKEINTSEFLLPNISLGYKIFDTCVSTAHALWGTVWTLTGEDNLIPNYQCQPKVPLSIIGDAVSSTSMAMATLLGAYQFPMVSYTSSVTSLSNRYLYPSFYRTIPSDDKQAKALAKLIVYMGWKWVGLLSLDDDYGIVGSQILKEELHKLGVCLAYHETFGLATSSTKLNLIADVVTQSTAKVIILFCRDPLIHTFLELLLERKVSDHIWLGTQGWSNSPIIATKKFSNIMKGTLAFALHDAAMPGFKEYLLSIRPSTFMPQDIFIEDFWEIIQDCRWPNRSTLLENVTVWCTGEETLTRFRTSLYEYDEFDFKTQYLIYNAIYAVAYALHQLIFSCNAELEECGGRKTIKPWQVSNYIKNIYFINRMGDEMYFDANGNPPTDYDLLNWHRNSDGTIQFVDVGRYNNRQSKENELIINVTSIRWITGSQEIPLSVCSDSCTPGFRMAAQKGQPLCCFDCIPCSEGEISYEIDSRNCLLCSDEMWPNENQTICIPKAIEFLSYWEPLGLTLTATVALCSFTTFSILCVFIKYKDTAIVKANNRDLTYLLLTSLSLSFLCSLLFIGEPQKLTCRFRQGAFGVIFVLSVSCVLAKTIMVVIAFRATKPGSNMRKWLGPKVPASTVSICTSIQVFICIYWIFSCPPFPERNIKIKTGVIIFQCNECSDTLLWCMLGYMAFLACISFLVAFLARKLPDSFNEAKWITFSMLIFLSVWISFVPAYLSTQGKYMVATEVFGILSSCAGIAGCIFFPKCYVILLRPDLNTRQNLLGRGTQNTIQ